VPHVTGENWTGKKTKVDGFKFDSREDDSQIKALKKPLSPGRDEPEEDEDDDIDAEDGGGHIPLHEIVAMQWHFVDKSKQMVGPMSVSALSKHWKAGEVNENSYVWTQGMGDWLKASALPDLILVLTHA